MGILPGKGNNYYCNGLFVSCIGVHIMAEIIRITLNFVRSCGHIIFTKFAAVRPYNASLKQYCRIRPTSSLAKHLKLES